MGSCKSGCSEFEAGWVRSGVLVRANGEVLGQARGELQIELKVALCQGRPPPAALAASKHALHGFAIKSSHNENID